MKKNRKGKAVEETSRRSAPWFYAAVVFIFAFLLYGKSLNYGYVLDDDLVIRKNAYVQQGFAGVGDILTRGYLAGFSTEIDSTRSQYRPLTLLHFAAENQLFGNNPAAGHFFNVFYYGVCGVVLFLLLVKIFSYVLRKQGRNVNAVLPALICTLLFLAHPVHTEVVANIKSRDEIFTLLFVLLSLLLLLRHIELKRKNMFVLSVFSFFLALLSKESSLTFLAIVPLFLYCFTEMNVKGIVRHTLPFVAVTAAFFLLRQMIIPKTIPEIEPLYNALLAIPSVSHRMATAMLIMGKYLWLLVYPHPLVWDYSYNQIPEVGWLNPWVILTVLACIALLVFAIVKLREKSVLSFCILWFFISMALTSNLIVYIGSTMAERFLFAPSLGFCLALVFLLFRTNAAMRYSAAGIVFILYSYATVARAEDWKDSFTLYMAGVKDSPNSAKTHFALGTEIVQYAQRSQDAATAAGLYRQAVKEYEIGLNIFSKDADAWYNYAAAQFNLGNEEEALKADERAVALEPRYAKAYNNIGVIYGNRNKLDEALKYFEKAAALDSNYIDAWNNIAAAHSVLGDFKKADEYYAKSLSLAPGNENTLLKKADNERKLRGDTLK